MVRVPTLLGPVGPGVSTVPKVAKAERTGELSRAFFICTWQDGMSNPVPDKLTCCGLSVLLSVMVRSPAVVPVSVGLKTTEMVQVTPAPTLAPQSFVWSNLPLVVMPVTFRLEVPVLVTETVFGLLVAPVATTPKFKLLGTSFALPMVKVIEAMAAAVALSTDVALRVTSGFEGTAGGGV